MNSDPVVIIGAGWAGLAAAVKLTQKGHRVIVYESAKHAGGRARSVHYKNTYIDNGQHILIGAYTECLQLMSVVGVDIHSSLKRLPLFLTTVDKNNKKLVITAPRLPAPLHLLYALLFAKGLTLKERMAAIYFGIALRIKNYALDKDTSFAELLSQTRQPDILIRQLWEPLCLAILNTPIHEASANIFMRVFRDAFTHKTRDADLLLPAVDLSRLFPDAAIEYITNHGGEVHFQTRVESLEITNGQIIGIHTKTERVHSQHIIITTAPQNINKLLSGHESLTSLSNKIKRLEYEPIVTVYLQYSESTQLPHPMTGMSSTLAQWVFDRGLLCGQAGLISVVISSHGEHMLMDDDKLTLTVHSEISKLFDNKPELIDAFVIREKRATFSCKVGINAHRPGNTTKIKGLYIAGDYTDTQYPATLEGTVRSGLSAAELCIHALR